MKTHRRWALLLAAAGVALLSRAAAADDMYVVKPVSDLAFADGTLPVDDGSRRYDRGFWRRSQVVRPYAVLDGGGEVCLDFPSGDWNDPLGLAAARIAVRGSGGQAVAGRLFVPEPDFRRMRALAFSIDADELTADDRADFLEVKLAHYRALLGRGIPGAAWFRHQARETERTLRRLGRTVGDAPAARGPFGRRPRGEMEDTFALVSGGRAVSENLQLDRVLAAPAGAAEATVAVDTIDGITVREFDWTGMIEGLAPATDPLAALIPEDQHAVLLPSFQALVDLVDDADVHGAPVLHALQPRGEHALVRRRYERQLGLPLDAFARLLGPQLVGTVAVTGSDPYLRTGSDVAVLLETGDPAGLQAMLVGRAAVAHQGQPAVRRESGEIDGVAYTSMRSPDRAVCSYIAVLEKAVVVTNSLAQLRRLAGAQAGTTPSLAALPEYTFFRDRYRRGEEGETALVVISDATIRRWCGPRWRIGTSRRGRAVAVMTEIQARSLDRLVAGGISTGPVYLEDPMPDFGELSLTPRGVVSSTYGTLAFQTPILELDLERVTQEEADLYARWRRAYQRNWRDFFDPIAARIARAPDGLSIDLTVMPLITRTEYGPMMDMSRNATLTPAAADRHEGTILHAAFALDVESGLVRQGATWASAMAPQLGMNPLAWLDDTIALYADEDPFWTELAAAEDTEDFMEHEVHRLPLALHVAVKDGLKLTAFLATVRAFIEQTAPGMTVWETRKHHDMSYVRVTPSEEAKAGDRMAANLGVCYAASGDSLIVTLNEPLLHRALDRRAARRAAGTDAGPAPDAWLGDNLDVVATSAIIPVAEAIYAESLGQQMQLMAWNNLPILNEWHRRYPNPDPVSLHEAFWQLRLICPGGGTYEWNDEWRTMESTVYGHPGAPKEGPTLPDAIRDIESGRAGLSFVDGGLRTRVKLQRRPAE
ncbi:MAG: hypothetical protein ACYTG1_03085 [Planctomycetota bacterium]|jgi:hypothetical protein